ncbi:MAG: type II toxin-antitoxin system prevent-host-death family antitoxin [Deltaproteobacteria bacterium]|nr:type II toxin-antitoxin system prevent-host-death family antitoxin [Deltaproteobacteria bacterium]
MDNNTISASELKNHCSKFVNHVAQKRGTVIITKHGRPVAKLVPMEDEEPASLFGFAKVGITIHGDIIEPLDVTWEATE